MSGLSTNVIYISVCHVVFILCVYKCQDFQPMWYILLFVMWFSLYVFINVRTFNQCDIYLCLSCGFHPCVYKCQDFQPMWYILLFVMSLHFLFMFCLAVFTPQKFVRATPLTSSKGIFQHFAFMLITKWRNQWRFDIVTWRQFNHTIFEGVIALFDFGKMCNSFYIWNGTSSKPYEIHLKKVAKPHHFLLTWVYPASEWSYM